MDRRKRAAKLIAEALRAGQEGAIELVGEHLDEELGTALLLGGLSGWEREDLELHLRGCPACRWKIEAYRKQMAPSPRRPGWLRPALAAGLLLAVATVLFLLGRREAQVAFTGLPEFYQGLRPAPGALAYRSGLTPILPQGVCHLRRPRFLWSDTREFATEEAFRERFLEARRAGALVPPRVTGRYFLTLARQPDGHLLLDALPVTGAELWIDFDLEEGVYDWWVAAAEEEHAAPLKRSFRIPGAEELEELEAELAGVAAAVKGSTDRLAARFVRVRMRRDGNRGWAALEEELAHALLDYLPLMREQNLNDDSLAGFFLQDLAEFHRLLGAPAHALWYRWLAREGG